jgi:hypothetical protein
METGCVNFSRRFKDQSRPIAKQVSIPHQPVSPAFVLIPTVLRPDGIRLRPSHANPVHHPHFASSYIRQHGLYAQYKGRPKLKLFPH